MSNSAETPVLITPPPDDLLARRWTSLLVLLALVVSGLGVVAAVVPAQARTVPDARCGTHDLGTGICVVDARGSAHWLGTRRGYGGVELYCIDHLFATRWGVEHRRTLVTGSLTTSLGAKVAPPTVAALSYLVTRYRAGQVDENTAAAISLLIRQVMGDVRRGSVAVIPGGLTVERTVRDVAFVPARVMARSRALWNEARLGRGPWKLEIVLKTGTDRKVTLGERITAVVRARTGAGRPQVGTVRLDYRGFTGPASVRLGKDGVARVALIAPRRPATGSVTARIDAAPSAHPVVVVPRNWSVNRRPGQPSSVTQRGLLGHQVPVAARASATARIVKLTPTVSTVASAQRVEPGATIHDTVIVTGTRGAAGSFRWSLLGPVKPLPDGRCPGVGATAWRSAKTIVAGSVKTSGDGTYRTPGYVVRRADVGCLTYVEQLAGTPTTNSVSTPPGITEETVLVVRPKSRPCISTVASRQSGLIGQEFFDRVRVGCISSPDRVLVAWTAHGPISPLTTGPNGCDRIPVASWRKAPVAARGSFVATRSATYATKPFTVKQPGCYTFSVTAAATATTTATSTPPGIAVETALFTRPPVPQIPIVPTGPYPQTSGDPLRSATYAGKVRIGGVLAGAPVTTVGVTGGAMTIPKDPGLLGWLRPSATAADVVGSRVIAGHVTSASGRAGALKALGRARPGTTIVWTDARGKAHRFVVTTVQKYPRSRPLPAAVFRVDGPPVLRVITCTERVRGSDGRYGYVNNLVVTARAVG